MEAVIGAVLEQDRLVLIGALIEIMAKLVVDGDEILSADGRAHLDPEIVLEIDIPGGGVADDLAVARLGDLRALPECRRQRIEPERGEKALTGLDHFDGIIALRRKDRVEIDRLAALADRNDSSDRATFLRPHIAQEIGPV